MAGKHRVTFNRTTNEIECECKDCSVSRVPNGKGPRCCYSEALQIWMALRSVKDALGVVMREVELR